MATSAQIDNAILAYEMDLPLNVLMDLALEQSNNTPQLITIAEYKARRQAIIDDPAYFGLPDRILEEDLDSFDDQYADLVDWGG